MKMPATFALNWSTENLISFLKEKNFGLDDDDFKILRNQKIDEYIFPLLTIDAVQIQNNLGFGI
jgi:hypothetical protein